MKIDYIELPANDLQKVQKFYQEVCNWKFKIWGDDYISFDNAGVMGGFRRAQSKNLNDEKPLVVLYSDNLNEAKKKILSAGGIVKKTVNFPGGERFYFEDPVGNELAVWTKKSDE